MRDPVITKALQHPDVLGAGAKKRKKLNPQQRFEATLAEYKKGTLWSGSGHKVKSRKQALRIAFEVKGGQHVT
jgi:hypothetical protein